MLDAATPRTGRTIRLASAGAAIARRPGLWIALAVLVAAAAIALLRARGPHADVAAVVRSDIEQHLVASGRVRVVTRVQLIAQAAGRVTRVAVREGQRVRAGDLAAPPPAGCSWRAPTRPCSATVR